MWYIYQNPTYNLPKSGPKKKSSQMNKKILFRKKMTIRPKKKEKNDKKNNIVPTLKCSTQPRFSTLSLSLSGSDLGHPNSVFDSEPYHWSLFLRYSFLPSLFSSRSLIPDFDPLHPRLLSDLPSASLLTDIVSFR